MRFGYVLLGLVTLTSIHTSSVRSPLTLPTNVIGRSHDWCGASSYGAEGQCSNGIVNGDICCDAGCGTCGGGGCGRRQGGPDNCCTSRIRDSGVMCSATQEAPCIIQIDSVCDNGVRGIQNGNICCDAMCGTCGGRGCARRPGGSSNCCRSRIMESEVMCDTTKAAPCIINDPTPAPTETPMMVPAPAPTETPMMVPAPAPVIQFPNFPPFGTTPIQVPVIVCENNFAGVQSGNICCETQCGDCGGAGCGGRPGGPASCCTGTITNNGVLCSTVTEAPCIIDN